jgi:hypothetical protein
MGRLLHFRHRSGWKNSRSGSGLLIGTSRWPLALRANHNNRGFLQGWPVRGDHGVAERRPNVSLSGSCTGVFSVQFFRGRRESKERSRRNLADAARRAPAAQARSEKIDKAKATFADAARTATGSAANLANLAKAGFAGARGRFNSWRRKGDSVE